MSNDFADLLLFVLEVMVTRTKFKIQDGNYPEIRGQIAAGSGDKITMDLGRWVMTIEEKEEEK